MDVTAYLLVINGPGAGMICGLDQPKVVMGRQPDCQIPIENPDASRHHAQIVRDGDEYVLEDLHSTNGTFLNEQPIRGRRPLREGDRIRISEFVYEFHLGSAPKTQLGPPRGAAAAPCVSVDDEGPAAVLLSQRSSSGESSSRSMRSLQAELDALLHITQSLRKSLVLDEIFPQILDTLFLVFPAVDRGFLVLQNEDGSLVPRWTRLRRGEAAAEIHISRTIISHVMESRQAVLSADAACDERFLNSSSIAAAPIRSMMCAPLIDGQGRCFGVLQVDAFRESGRFQEEDLEILLAVSIQASIAIDNARLHEMRIQQKAMERELELADRIQRGFLPSTPPEYPGYRFHHYYCPAGYVGGDFFDYVSLPDGRLMVFMADVSGHGLAAAMVTARLAMEIRCCLLAVSQPAELVQCLNASLGRCLPQDHFITLLLVELTPGSGQVRIVNAGHLLPLLCHPGGQVSTIEPGSGDMPLGVGDDTHYHESCLSLPAGATMVLYTDGISDATGAAEQVYGSRRIREQLAAARGGPAEIAEWLVADVRRFVGGQAQRDDMCLVCIGRD